MKIRQPFVPTTVNLTRFRNYFPIAASIIENVWFLLPLFVLIAAIGSLYSIHYSLSALCVWIGMLCFWVDRKHLNYCLFTPLQPLATVSIMSLGFGISMVVFESEEKYSYGLFCMQLMGVLTFPLFMLGYHLITKRVPGFVFPRHMLTGNEHFTKPLVFVGWVCMLHELGKVVAGVASGSMDRGVAGDFLIDTPFGWWSAFSIFFRIQTLGFVLVPLIWRESKATGRLAISAVVIVCLFLHFVAASRGAFFMPIFIMVIGCYMFWEFKRLKYEAMIALGLIGITPLITVMSFYRTSQEFKETDIRNIFQKLSTITYGIQNQRDKEAEGEKYAEAGRAFIGVADSYIYEMTPDVIPHGGAERLEDIVWVFIPYILTSGTSRPLMQDGNIITSHYRGYQFNRTSIGISYPAELYRRWGWVAVPLGLFAYGLFYGLVFRTLHEFYLLKNALLGFIFCGIAFHFFVAWYFHTVINNAWYWFYDTPKHMALLLGIYFVARLIYGNRKVPGALALMKTDVRA